VIEKLLTLAAILVVSLMIALIGASVYRSSDVRGLEVGDVE